MGERETETEQACFWQLWSGTAEEKNEVDFKKGWLALLTRFSLREGSNTLNYFTNDSSEGIILFRGPRLIENGPY